MCVFSFFLINHLTFEMHKNFWKKTKLLIQHFHIPMELEFNDQAKIAVTQPNVKNSNFPSAFQMIQEFYWTQLQLIFRTNVKINKNNPCHKSFLSILTNVYRLWWLWTQTTILFLTQDKTCLYHTCVTCTKVAGCKPEFLKIHFLKRYT